MTLLVTGATGQFGSTVIDSLLKRGLAAQLAVSVRNPAKASSYKERGIDIRQGDFDDSASLTRAFSGVDRLLIISTDGDNETRIRQHKTAVHAAQAAGVRFIAYTSISNASNNPLSLAEVHRATEDAIRATRIPYAFLRNNWYLENELGFVQAALAGAPITTSAGKGRVGWALRADMPWRLPLCWLTAAMRIRFTNFPVRSQPMMILPQRWDRCLAIRCLSSMLMTQPTVRA